MESNQGWIKLHRKLLENCISNKPSYLSVWVHLLLMCNHQEEHSFIWNNKRQTLKSGEVLTGLKQLSKKTGIPKSSVERILKYLENEKQISLFKTTKFTVVSILNWDKYQSEIKQSGKQMGNKRETDGTQMGTFKNEKKEENEKKEISKDITSESFGNEDINFLINHLKIKSNLGNLDGSEKQNRNYCYNLLRRFKKQFPEREPKELIVKLIDYASTDKYHSTKLSSFSYLFYNYNKMLLEIKKKHDSPSLVIIS